MSERIIVVLVFLFSLVVIFSSNASENLSPTKFTYEKSIPDNDLWKQDCLGCKDNSGIDESMFSQIIDVALEQYSPIAQRNNEQLVINKNWEDATVNASCSRMWNTVEIQMYGGLARREEITAEGFTLVLCHELSHAYGGAPYIRTYNKMSAEGQADYMSTFDCAKKIFNKLDLNFGLEITPYMERVCGNNDTCLFSLVGGQSLGNLLAKIKNEIKPNFETPDPLVVTTTNLTYPQTIQCRLDTYHNGALGKTRPLCWYKP